MDFAKLLENRGILSAITIGLLLSSYIFTIFYNISSSRMGDVSPAARFFMLMTIIFLFMFLAGFVLFLVSVFRLADVREIFLNPMKVSIISIIMLLCSFLSTVMNNFTGKMFGELSSVSQIFFYLGLVFLVFFVVTFLAMLVSFSNKFLYSRKL